MEIARYWRTNNQRYHLQGTICIACGALSMTTRRVCDRCQRDSIKSYPLFNANLASDIALLLRNSAAMPR